MPRVICVLWDLDETILPSEPLRELRHGQPSDLARHPAWGRLVPHPGVVEVLRRIRCRQALVTSSPRWYVEQIRQVHLDGVFFSTTITFDDVTRIKPDPEPLHLALAHMGYGTAQTVFVGDDLVDQEACAAAGVTFLGAGWAGSPTFEPDRSVTLDEPSDLLDYLATSNR